VPAEAEPPLRVLHVEDSVDDVRIVERWLARLGPQAVEVVHVPELDAALSRLEREEFDVAVVDLSLPDSGALATLHGVLHLANALPVVVLTASDDDEIVGVAARGGVREFLVKGRTNAMGFLMALARSQPQRSRALLARLGEQVRRGPP
jgi:CheY-like chemotaxis protein